MDDKILLINIKLPLKDSKQTRLLQELDSAFNALPNELKEIYVNLLNDNKYLKVYFSFINKLLN